MLRKSLANIVLDAQQVLGENNDEVERLILRRNSKENNSPLKDTPSDRRHSLGLSCLMKIPEPQMNEHISHCIKLNTENKISVKNAFSLEMIDFMTFMVVKTQSKITDLQVASVALDVCTNIYAYRVDSLYTDILKMAGGLNKQEKKVNGATDEQQLCEDEQMPLKNEVKKKRKNKQQLISTERTLNGCIETMNPLQLITGLTDSCTSDMLYQVTLPIHANSDFYYHRYKDVILDTVDDITMHEKSSPEYTVAAIEDCSNLDICPSFSDFTFLNWSYNEETDVTDSNQENNETRFQFDLDASIANMEEHDSEPINYFNIEGDEENVNLCTKDVRQVENIVNLTNIVLMQTSELDKPSEYSFIQRNLIHWAGPSYWKLKTFGKILGNSKVVETCRQTGIKKNEVRLEYNDNIKSEMKEKFTLVDVTKIQFKTTPKSWKKAKTLPQDIHYNDSQLNVLYILPSIILRVNQNQDKLNTNKLPGDENYNYGNENDTSDFCPNMDTHSEEVQEWNDQENSRIEDMNTEKDKVAFIGDNLIALPKLTQKVVVPYAHRAKKIDMRQLKQSIWKSLTSTNNKEKDTDKGENENENEKKVRESKSFSIVYKSLPIMLLEKNKEALNFPIAFVSLLHLANEKSLSLSSLPDFSDIIINEE